MGSLPRICPMEPLRFEINHNKERVDVHKLQTSEGRIKAVAAERVEKVR